MCTENDAIAEFAAPLQEALQESYPVVFSFLDDEDWSARRLAAIAATKYLRTPGLAAQRPALVACLHARADASEEERALWVRQLSLLDEDTRPYLSDPDPVVRTCAALAPGLAGDAAVTDLIVAELIRVLDYDVNRLLDPDLYDFTDLIDVTIARVDDFERIAAPDRTIVRRITGQGPTSREGPWS